MTPANITIMSPLHHIHNQYILPIRISCQLTKILYMPDVCLGIMS